MIQYTLFILSMVGYIMFFVPAIIRNNKAGVEYLTYYINGKEYTKEEFNEYIKGLDSKEDLDMLSDLGQTFD